MSVPRPITVVPPLTPFADDLSVDMERLEGIVDYVVEDCNASWVIVAGVEAQEYQYLDPEARRELIRRTIEFVGGRRPTAVGISHPSFREAASLANLAEDLGADAIQLLAPRRPFGGECTSDELMRYFDAVIAETTLPIVLYLNAGPGADVSVKDTVELAKLDRISMIKESSRDLSRVGRLIADIDLAGHARYLTTVQMLLATLELGGSGVTLPPPAALLADRIISAWTSGDAAEAARLQGQFRTYPSRWMHRGLMPAMKASLNLMGVPAGDPYPPFAPIRGEELDALRTFLATTDLTPKE